ncbi:MAG TPA: family 1 encapsulin nanocompartment shell protein [Clostridia bacterium]|nr:family 1 encapsulin nanocompartment shell protein [Clostridia bacterium]
MSYLSRDAASLPEEFWAQIDSAVVKAARNVMTGRRFLRVFGPLGIGVGEIAIDDADAVEEVDQDGILTTAGRKYAEIPTLYADFTLLAKDLERAEKSGYPADLSKAMSAAEACALKEEKLIYFGNEKLGYEGLLTAKGVNTIAKKDWSVGENAFADISAAIALLAEKGLYGPYALVMSPDLFMQLQRLQPGTGLLEIERVSKLTGGHVYKAPVLGKGKAALVCSDSRNMDLVIGQDMAAAYLEQKDLNHSFRVLETVLPRIKRKQAIVVFE